VSGDVREPDVGIVPHPAVPVAPADSRSLSSGGGGVLQGVLPPRFWRP
jgi:hypothetical protein